MTGPLHVTNGDVVADAIAASSLDGTTLVWADVLHTGPLEHDLERSRTARARFLASCGWGEADVIAREFEARDDELARSVDDGRPVVLWFEHDLFDQLLLLQVLTALTGADPGQVELVQAHTYLGSLGSSALEELWPGRAAVPRAAFDEAAAVWRAVCDEDLDSAAALESGALPHLGNALRRLREERTQPSRTRRQLLGALGPGPRSASEAYLASQSREAAVFLGDAWAYGELAALADDGLVQAVDATPLPPAPPRGGVQPFADVILELTPAGRAHV